MSEHATVSVDEAFFLHRRLIAEFGGNPGVRDAGLLESALARPFASVEGRDAHPSLAEKAAALLESLVRNHPFVDGNKRVGYATTAAFLRKNGMRLVAAEEEEFDLVMGVADGRVQFAEIRAWISARLTPL